MPVTVIFSRPDGVEHSRVTLPDQGQGGRATTLALPGSAMTGTWRAKVHTDPKANPIAQTAFLVEDFVPERLELKLEPAVQGARPRGSPASSSSPAAISTARRPPASPSKARSPSSLAKGDLPGFAGYQFGLADEQVAPVRKPLEGLPATDAEGKADIAVRLPALPKTSRPLEADVILKLRESGGRTIERTVTLPVDLQGAAHRHQAAVRRQPGRRRRARALRGDPARSRRQGRRGQGPQVGADAARPALAVVQPRRLVELRARHEHPPRRHRHGRRRARHAGQDRGQGRLGPLPPRSVSADGSGLISSMVFNAGWYADEAADSPEVLDVALDKPAYKAGDTARVKITSRMAGRALIAVHELRPRLHAGGRPAGRRRRDRRSASASDWSPGAYVTVMLYRPMDEKAKRMPCARSACAGSPSTRRRACST